MLKSVLPKVLFVLAIVGIIAAGNYFFKEDPATVVAAAPVEQPAEAETEPQEPSDEPAE
jgi:hypothetical protein